MQNKEPVISVIMPVYNSERFLKEAIESILNQSFEDFEFIIINDGSTDSSEAIILKFNDSRIIYLKNNTNIGVIKTRNIGIDHARGKYIAKMDSDDISLLDRFAVQYDYLENNPACAVLTTNIQLIDEKGNEIGFWEDDLNTKTYEEISTYLPKLNCIAQPAVMAKTEVLKKYKYNINQHCAEDWDLWLRIIADGLRIEKINFCYLKYRIVKNSLTQTSNRLSTDHKIFNLQKNYLLAKLNSLSFKKYDLLVLKSFLHSFKKLFFTQKKKQIKETIINFIVLNFFFKKSKTYQFKAAKKFLITQTNPNGLFFFFPFYHVGGAERVHLDILKVVAEKNPWIFITSKSANDAFYEEFMAYGKVITIGDAGDKRAKRLQDLIASKINAHNNAIVFTCNSIYCYETIMPKLNSEVKCIDLMHAFSGNDYNAAEHWSIPFISSLNKRIFISKKTISELEQQYKSLGIAAQYLSNIKFISNGVVVPEIPIVKEYTNELKILYVGRGSSEKRLHIICKVAQICKEQSLSVAFGFVGDLINSIDKIYHPYIHFYNEIVETDKMNSIYNQAHIIMISSHREGFPMVIMEGMAHGLVPISTNVGDIPTHVIDGKTGYCIDNEQEEVAIIAMFVEKIALLHQDRDLLKVISENAYLRAQSHFNISLFEHSYRELFGM